MNETSASSSQSQISHEAISRRAEDLWRNYGTPDGRDEEIWLEAERQLRSEQKSSVPAAENVATKSAPIASTAASAQTAAATRPIASKESELMEKNASSVPSRPKSRSSKSR